MEENKERKRQELLMLASQLHNESKENEEKLNFLNSQILELNEFRDNLTFLIDSTETETISNIGKGVYMKTEIKSKKLFVQVGAGIVIRKTPEETKNVIESQILRLRDAKNFISSHFESYQNQLQSIISEIEKLQN